jgi:hypothetical protein
MAGAARTISPASTLAASNPLKPFIRSLSLQVERVARQVNQAIWHYCYRHATIQQPADSMGGGRPDEFHL